MTENDARAWLAKRWPSDRIRLLERYVALLIDATSQQNLISRASIDQIWQRHIVDSAQLIPLAEDDSGHWLDVGAGAGLPGMVIRILTGQQVTMVEPRPMRTAFLNTVLADLNFPDVVSPSRVEALKARTFDTIVARAYASLSTIFLKTHRFAHADTRWILPKGRSANSELEQARVAWHGVFHVEQSVTDPDAGIIIAASVRPKDRT